MAQRGPEEHRQQRGTSLIVGEDPTELGIVLEGCSHDARAFRELVRFGMEDPYIVVAHVFTVGPYGASAHRRSWEGVGPGDGQSRYPVSGAL